MAAPCPQTFTEIDYLEDNASSRWIQTMFMRFWRQAQRDRPREYSMLRECTYSLVVRRHRSGNRQCQDDG